MTLKILENNGIFYVDGKINTSTIHSFFTYFDSALMQKHKVVINIDAVNEIDSDGLATLNILIKTADKKNKVLLIVGKGCKDIYDHFRKNQVA